MGVVFGLITPWNNYLLAVLALVCGSAFGLCMALLVSSSWVKQSATPRFEPDEQIIKASPASHLRGVITMGGWLYLTDKRLVFRTHTFLQKSYELAIPLADIAQAQPAKMAWFITNGLTITTDTGQIERFVVEQGRQWSDAMMVQRPRTSPK